MKLDFGGGSDCTFLLQGCAGIVTLARPSALNALSHEMIRSIARALTAWAADDRVRVVIVRGEGRAFCAGGDLRALYERRGTGRLPVEFFADEYRLNALVASFPKPYVALVDGLAMGGGIGISCHGSHRLLSENAVLAMPEVGIGFFPDVGASHLLPRLAGEYGMYLALTGEGIGQREGVAVCLGTHAVDSADIPLITDEIAETGEPDRVLSARARKVPREKDEATLHTMERHFSYASLEDCLHSLGEAADKGEEFASEALSTIRKRSPTSLHVAFRAMRSGAMLSMEECLRMEYRIVTRMLANPDFYEGIRAALIDRDGSPRWRPATLEDVDEAAVEAFFAPLGDAELDL